MKKLLGILLALCMLLALLSASALSEKESILVTNEVPRVGPYSQMIRAGGFVFCSAQAAFDPATGALIEGDIAAQTRQILTNFAAELADAGLTLDDAVDVTVYIADITMFAEMNAAYSEFFSEPYPVRACVEVSALPVEGALLTIKLTALDRQGDEQPAQQTERSEDATLLGELYMPGIDMSALTRDESAEDVAPGDCVYYESLSQMLLALNFKN